MNKKTVIFIAVGAVAAAVVLWYVISRVTTPPPGDCANPNSACGVVLSKYSNLLGQCLAQEQLLFNTYLKESPQGFTQSELNSLNSMIQNCNNIAYNMAKVANQFNYNPLNALVQYVGYAVDIAAGIIATSLGISIYKNIVSKYKFYANYNGATGSNILTASTIDLLYQQGVIGINQAQFIVSTTNTLTQTQIYLSQNFEQTLVISGLAVASAAATLEVSAEAGMLANAAAIASLFGA